MATTTTDSDSLASASSTELEPAPATVSRLLNFGAANVFPAKNLRAKIH